MKSHLTRRVLRSILANEPIIHRGCPRRRPFGTVQSQTSTRPATSRQHGLYTLHTPQRRAFFDLGVFGDNKRSAKEADLDPGLEKMQELEKMKRMRARLPHPEDVAHALATFFEAKRRHRRKLTDTQARLAHEGMKYCLEAEHGIGTNQLMSQLSLLQNAITAIGRLVDQPTNSHAELALLVLNITWKNKVRDLHGLPHPLLVYVNILSRSGRSSEARKFVQDLKPEAAMSTDQEVDSENIGDHTAESNYDSGFVSRQASHLWRSVMVGLAKEGKLQELLETLEEVKNLGFDAEKLASPAMLDVYMQGDDASAVQRWLRTYWHATREGLKSRARASTVLHSTKRIRSVLSWCLQHDQLAMGHALVREILSEDPPKRYWDAILVWAAGTGKGADEIDRMLGVMADCKDHASYKSGAQLSPDIVTINDLVEFAISKSDPYLAERFIALGKQRGIEPDARTYVLQMQYRLKVNDIDGALVAYTNMQSMDISDNRDVPTVNELVVALCNSKRHDFDTIMNVAADLSDRRARFEPLTTATLALLHLNRDEVLDVTDLLNTHVNHYSSIEREKIRNTIFDYCANPATPTSRAWDGYTVLRNSFDEMPRSQRTALMVSFFERQRSDMATHIFSSMRSHSRKDTVPTIDTYVAAFLACAKLRDIDVLEVIHNQLKLDYNIDPSTYLYNALMIGYTAGGKPRRALEFWDQIVASREGPTYNSIHIALRACEKAAFGDVKAQEIWRRLRKTNLDLDHSLWASYAGALIGNGNAEVAINAMEEAESHGEVEIDAHLVGSLLSGCPAQAKQDEVEAWAKEKHPQAWKELERIGIESDEIGLRSVKIDRTVTP